MNKGRIHIFLAVFIVLCLLMGMTSFVFAEESLTVDAAADQKNEISTTAKKDSDVHSSEENSQVKQSSASDQTNNEIDKPELIIEEIINDEAYDISLINVSNSTYDFVIIKVWSTENESDMVLYPAEWQDSDLMEENESPYYLAHILINNHNYNDTYHVVAYGITKNDSIEIESTDDITFDTLSNEEISTEIVKTSFEIDTTETGSNSDEIADKEDGTNEMQTQDSIIEDEDTVSDNPNPESPKLMLKAASSNTSIRGIDVSKHNGSIDWAKVKAAGIKYAIIRCGYGDNITSQDDSKWTYNVSECERLGIPYGVYIYSYATSLSHVQSEADHCIRLLKGHHPNYPVFLDLEDSCMANLSNANLASFTQAWATKIMSAGYTPGVYSSKNWWTNKLTSSVFNNYCKWVAQWNTSCTYTGTYHSWQYSSTGSVNGISGNVDMDYWYGYSNFTINYGQVSGSGPEFGLYEMISTVDTNYAIDVNAASQADKANVQLYVRNGTGAQKFWVIPLGYDNQYYIMNRTSGKYLDVDGNNTEDKTNIHQYTGNGTSAQRFRINSIGNGEYELQGVGSDKYLDLNAANASNGSNIQIYTGNHTAAQKWKLVLTKDNMPTNYTYQIVSSINTSYSIDILGASKADKANAQLYKRNTTLAQKFTFVPLGHDDLYYIINKGSGKALDVDSNGTADKTNVWQYTRNGTRAQKVSRCQCCNCS